MIEFSEHFYDDDPRVGHPDARTRLEGASYFFLGNGFIQAAVQLSPSGEGTPLGLLVMDPEKLARKREAAGFDPETGLARTMLRIVTPSGEHVPCAGTVKARWTETDGVPAVEARWDAGELEIRELFYCPDCSSTRLSRAFELTSRSARGIPARVRTGVRNEEAEQACTVAPGGTAAGGFTYFLGTPAGLVTIAAGALPPTGEARARQAALAQASFGDDLLDRLFTASRNQLPALVSARGRMDGSIWQYTREWVRDQSLNAVALAMIGQRDTAATILRRLLTEFVTDEGATLDSGEVRGREDVELDQNGVLAYALHQYVRWTWDLDLVASLWPRLAAALDYPLRPAFRHVPSRLLWNCREYWERHRAYGIDPGFELTYQVFVAMGLTSGAAIARLLGRSQDAERWSQAAAQLKHAVLRDPRFALQDENGLVKRRRLDGSIQDRLEPRPEAALPSGVPLTAPGEHWLRPDTCAALPIAFEFVDPCSPLAARTLEQLEPLWNQAWDIGGYGRYHVSSEGDSPGPWPFASLFVARAAIEAGAFDKAMRVLQWMDTVPGAAAGSWFEFYGPRPSPPFPQVGVIPWTWSELIVLFVHHVLGIRPEDAVLRLRPRVLPGLAHVTAAIPVRHGRLLLDLRSGDEYDRPRFEVQDDSVESDSGQLLLPYWDGDLRVRAFLPAPRWAAGRNTRP